MKYIQQLIILSGLMIAFVIISYKPQVAPNFVYACVPSDPVPTGACAVFGPAPVIEGSCTSYCTSQVEVPDGPPEYLPENLGVNDDQLWYQPTRLECVAWSDPVCEYGEAPCIEPEMTEAVTCPEPPLPPSSPELPPPVVIEPEPTPEPTPEPEPIIVDPEPTPEPEPEPSYASCGGTTINNCTLSAANTSVTPYNGVCGTGSGTCSYTCFDGSWSEYNNSNTCNAYSPTITASMRDVRINTSVVLTYDTGGHTCTLRVGNTPITGNLTASGVHTVVVQAQTTYILDCDGSVDPSVTVRILPRSFET